MYAPGSIEKEALSPFFTENHSILIPTCVLALMEIKVTWRPIGALTTNDCIAYCSDNLL